MGKLAGVKLEKDTSGRIKKITLDMKYHAAFIEDYLDRLRIKEAKENADFVDWNDVKSELDKKHGITTHKTLHGRNRTQSRKAS